MATHTNVSKTNQPTHPHASSGLAILIAGLAVILAVGLVAISTLFSAPQTGSLSASSLGLDAAAARYQGLADGYIPLRLGAVGTWAARYERLANAYTMNKPTTLQALSAWSARYGEQAKPYMISTSISQRVLEAWAARNQGSYSLLEVSVFPAVVELSTSEAPISKRAVDAWAAQYTGRANSYVPESLPISRPVFNAWVSRSTGMAGTAVTHNPAFIAWTARYASQAFRFTAGKPVSQKALAAWSARYAGMLAAID